VEGRKLRVSRLAWVQKMILSASNPSSIDEDDYISDGSVECCVEYEQAPVVARGERTHIASWDNLFSFPGKRKAVFRGATSNVPPETCCPGGEDREQRNHEIQGGEMSGFHALAPQPL